MIVRDIHTAFVRPPNPNAQHLRCFAQLDGDIGDILPHLNTVLKGHLYYRDPPSLTLKYQAKLITLYPKSIAINIVRDETEANAILEWLKQEINATWQQRDTIPPSYEVKSKPGILNILRGLPRTNCRQCGAATCLVFATQVSEGERSLTDCPEASEPPEL